MEPNGSGSSGTEFTTSRPISSFVETVRGVILDPAGFYRGIQPSGSLKNPVVFAILCGIVSFPLSFLAAPFDPFASNEPVFPQGLSSLAADNLPVTVVLVTIGLILLPLFALLGLYVGALIQHLFVMIFVRQRRNFEATLRVVAYGSALLLLSWIPILGYIATFYLIYVYTVGFKELHSASTTRALLAALVPALLSLSFAILSIFIVPSG